MAVQIVAPVQAFPKLPIQRYEVQTRERWTYEWATSQYLTFVNGARRVAPSIARATLGNNYGNIKRETGTELEWESPQNLTGHYVRIRAIQEVERSWGLYTQSIKTVLFTGIISDDEVKGLGINNTTQNPIGDQGLVAYDFGHLMDREEIDETAFYQAAEIKLMDRVLPFNIRSKTSSGLQGNRTENKQEYPGDDPGNEPEIHLFDDTEDAEVWTHLDAVEYLLTVFSLPDMEIGLTGQFADLAGITSSIDPSGKSLFDLLNLLINRKYGFGWFIEVIDDKVSVSVFTNTETDISLGTLSIGKNANQIAINIDNSIDVISSVNNMARARKYTRVIAEGDFPKAMGTFGKSAPSFENGWSSLSQTAYENAAGDDPETKDENRKSDALRRVWQTWRVPEDWDGNNIDGSPMLPKVGDKGEVELSTDFDPIYRTGKTFLRYLLLEEDSADIVGRPEYMSPLAIVYVEEDEAYQLADLVRTDECNGFHVRMLDSEMGVELRGAINHLFALNDWAPSGDESEITPVFDADKMYTTAAFEGDKRIKYTAEVTNGWFHSLFSDPASEGQTLHLRFPTCQCWLVADGTMVGVKDGEILTWNKADNNDSNIIRTDMSKLEARAKAALAWYGVERSLMHLVGDGLTSKVELGTMVLSTAHGNTSTPVGTVVSELSWSVQKSGATQTTIKTAWFELDWGAGGDPGEDDPKTMLNDIKKVKEAAAMQVEHTQNLPVRTPPIPF